MRSELGPPTATWSGMIAEDKALVRTVSFNNGNPVTKTVNTYDRPVQMEFGPRGQNFWVYPDGNVEAAGRSVGH